MLISDRFLLRTKRLLAGAASVFASISAIPIASQAPGPWIVFGALFGTSVILFSGYLLTLVTIQRRRNVHMARLLSSKPLHLPGTLPLCLYLRSFAEGESGYWARIKWVLGGIWLSDRNYEDGFEPEEEIADALGVMADLVAIGDRELSFGAAKLRVTDSQWKEAFARLADQASIIFLLPGTSEAVLWEAQQLVSKSHLRNKSIAIMPRNISRDRWRDIVFENGRALGISFPDYLHRGCFFDLPVVGHAPTVQNVERFMDAFRDAVRRIDAATNCEFDVPELLAAGKRLPHLPGGSA